MEASELLERVATTLRREIGPAVETEYPRTQAFLSAVVLQKLAAELRLASEHGEQGQQDREALRRDLARLIDEVDAPAAVREAFASIEDGDAGLCRFIEMLYAARGALGETGFEALLTRVRQCLRRSLDRRMEVAG